MLKAHSVCFKFRLKLNPHTTTFVVEVERVIDVHYTSLTSQGVQHRVFQLDGHPSRYQPHPRGLNFGEQTGTGVSSLVTAVPLIAIQEQPNALQPKKSHTSHCNPRIANFVTIHRPHLSHFWENVLFALYRTIILIYVKIPLFGNTSFLRCKRDGNGRKVGRDGIMRKRHVSITGIAYQTLCVCNVITMIPQCFSSRNLGASSCDTNFLIFRPFLLSRLST